MTVAYYGKEFGTSLHPMDGGPGWDIGVMWEDEPELYATNPRYAVPRYAASMLNLWQACVDGDGNIRVLPDEGGMMDQPAIMVDALSHLSHLHREIVTYERNKSMRS